MRATVIQVPANGQATAPALERGLGMGAADAADQGVASAGVTASLRPRLGAHSA